MKAGHRARIGAAIAATLVATGAQAANNLALEEVVVTAQKREQSAMTVPVTVDTFSTQDLENTGALTMTDIQAYIPGLKVGTNIQDAGGVTQSSFVISRLVAKLSLSLAKNSGE